MAEPPARLSGVESRRGALTGLHILVVEDNEGALEILRAVLEYSGALVTTATRAAEGMRCLREATPDAVLIDFRLPDHNGTWLVREGRTIPYDGPFIAVSALDFDGRLEDHGFDAFVRKPVDHDRLVDAVLAAIKRR